MDVCVEGRTPRGQSNNTGSLSGQKQITKRQIKGPPKAGAFKQKVNHEQTQFQLFYERGDLPIAIDNSVKGSKLRWKAEIEKLDYHHYLPLFFDGLRETREPYGTMARQGVRDMLMHRANRDMLQHGADRVLPVVPQLIIPIKKALDTRIPSVLCCTLRAIQDLVRDQEQVGEALVPYYRQILPVLNVFKNCNSNTGDGIDYSQHKQQNVGDLVTETLELLERTGGEDAFINIKYMVPTYESALFN